MKTLEEELQAYGYSVAEVATLVSFYPEWLVRAALSHGALKMPESLGGGDVAGGLRKMLQDAETRRKAAE